MSAYFQGVNRNKRSLALDLSNTVGQSVLLRMLRDADVLIENFKAGQMEKWGLGYDATLRDRFPSLVYAQMGHLQAAPGSTQLPK